jgi:hypothetical protein
MAISCDAYPVEESFEKLGFEVVHYEETRGSRPGAARGNVRVQPRAVQLTSMHGRVRGVAWGQPESATCAISVVLFDALVVVALSGSQDTLRNRVATSSVQRQRGTVES